MTQNNDKDGVVIIGSPASGIGRAAAAASMRAEQSVIITTPENTGNAFMDKYGKTEAAIQQVEQHKAIADMDEALGSFGVYNARIGERQSNTAVNVQAKNNEATNLINMLTGYEQEEAKPASVEASIPCGYKEPISDGKTLTCGNTYRGETFYCRDCMTSMMKNAHEVANSMAEVMLVAYNDHATTGQVAQSSIDAIWTVLSAIGCEPVSGNND